MPPELPDDNFTTAWRKVVAETREAAAPDRLLFISFTFSNDLTQNEFLDRVRAELEELLNSPDFRSAMRWDKPQGR